MRKVRLAIVGFDQVGQSLMEAVEQHEDLVIQHIFSRQSKQDLPKYLQTLPIHSMEQIINFKESIDVLIVCSGSTYDNPENLSEYAADFNLVDAYNFYAKPALLLKTIDSISQVHHKLAVIGVGWNPGLYTVNQLLAEAVMPQATNYHFVENEWSQKMSETIFSLEGVAEANVYLKASPQSLQSVLDGEQPDLGFSDYQERVAYLVLEEGVDPDRIEDQLQALPNFLSQAEMRLHFTTSDQLAKLSKEVQAGRLIRTAIANEEVTIYDLTLSFNQPRLNQANLLLAYARAVYRLASEGRAGALTQLDVPVSYLSKYTRQELLDKYL
ncbi:diaminopimelate dehydrogenase [Facklamia sp. 7083-14-GEN3]|uniref:diaminopimelate dehydrogenase n=1 Tax=Facklamia sp. 7083-14-GEN3 TaxID=2973478 RepID=UPI00215CAB7C|nr:diaminopimelate dehydrogenase [Facklamia sp. 7083-14-GEN3]MCR8969033.1 diaminopimelate dehydrogenase [Facklamia sp. 7083-14-GEN3]